jgi:protein-disulfide isomerase
MLMRIRPGIATLALLLMLGACGGNPADIDELKKGQKEILDKLAALDKTVQQMKTSTPAPAARPTADPNKPYNIPLTGSPARGAEFGKVTIVEFADYQCPFCQQAEGLVKQVLDTYPKDARLVYKQFPLTSIHPQAMSAAKAALAAGRQGKYWEMHQLLFDNQRQLGPDKYLEFAEKLQLDAMQFQKDMESPEVLSQINRELQEGKAADVSGTPTIFVNGKRLMNRSLDGFKQMIEVSLGRPPAPPAG